MKQLVNRGTRWEIEYAPVEFDDRMLRIMLNGRDPKNGYELKGGPLHLRVPKA